MSDRPLKEIWAVAEEVSLPEILVRLCCWAAALTPHAVLRMALPPGLEISTYVVRHPVPSWLALEPGSVVGRKKLRRFLGSEGLKAAEETGRVVFAPTLPAQRTVE